MPLSLDDKPRTGFSDVFQSPIVVKRRSRKIDKPLLCYELATVFRRSNKGPSHSYLRSDGRGSSFRMLSTMRGSAVAVLVICYVCSSAAFMDTFFGGSSSAQDLSRSISSLGAPNTRHRGGLESLEGILEMMRPVLEQDGLPGSQWPIVLPVPVRKYHLIR